MPDGAGYKPEISIMNQRPDGIMLDDLADARRWVGWRVDMRDGKPRKVPYSPVLPPYGPPQRAAMDNPATWGTRAQAEALRDRLDGFQGVGIALGPIDGTSALGGIDLDTCIAGDGQIEPWAIGEMRRFRSYTEISPSGTGAKLLFRYNPECMGGLARAMGDAKHGKQFKAGTGEHPPSIEVYFSNRFFAVTEKHLAGTPEEIHLAFSDDLLRLLEVTGPTFARRANGPKPEGAGNAKAAPGDAAGPDWFDAVSPGAGDDADAELLTRLHRKMTFNGRLHRRWYGDFSGMNDASRSAVAMAIGGALKRAGFTKDEVARLLRRNPHTAEWMAEKGMADGGRELHRLWEHADAPRDEDAADTEGEAASGSAAGKVTWPPGFSMRTTGHNPGLYFQPEDPDKPAQWLAAPFVIEGATRDSRGSAWGLRLRWVDRDWRIHRWALPLRALMGEPGSVEAEMMDQGLRVSPLPARRQLLRNALAAVQPETLIACVTRAGWHLTDGGPVYVLPDGEVIGEAAEPVILQGGAADGGEGAAVAGTLDGWQREVAALAVGNDAMGLFLSAAFAGALLDVTGDKSGGFHLYGKSQAGKTTLLRTAASVWGAPEMGAVMRSWRATANGLEATAAEASDGLLPLDEIGQADGREVAEVVYLLGNESGKRRANREGGSRRAKTWRLVFLSTGEMDLAAKLAEAGKRMMAGQDVRMVSLPLDGPDGRGLLRNLHGRPTATALLVHLNEAVRRHHGTAARAFLAALAEARAADAAGLAGMVEQARSGFLAEYLPKGADGQVQTVGRRFGLAAAAGELAIGFGVLPWPAGEAARAVGACFKAWLSRRGGAGAAEEVQAVQRVASFIALHGASRFATIADGGAEDGATVADEVTPDRPVINRAGWRRLDAAGRWEYLIFCDVWDREICAGADPREVARTLRDKRLLFTEGADRLKTRAPRIRGYDRPRVYHVSGAILGGGEGEA